MDMDTHEITINRIVGFQWDEPGTDVEDEVFTCALFIVLEESTCKNLV